MISQDAVDGIETYIRHVRKMSMLNDDVIRIMVAHIQSQDPNSVVAMNSDIDGYISKMRQMSLATDDQLRSSLRDAATKDPELEEMFGSATKRKNMMNMEQIAKDIAGDPRKFARKVDREY